MSAQRDYIGDYRWVHDDAEEELVGAEWHQHAIRLLYFSLDSLARRQGWPWHVGDQTTLVGWKPDDSPWRLMPDISLFPSLGPERREEIHVRETGVPALVIEVASKTTWRKDVSFECSHRRIGKAYAYLTLMGVPAYLVFDPMGEYLGTACRGWQRVGQQIETWEPAADGCYRVPALDIALRPEETLLRVLGPGGTPVPFAYEQDQQIAQLRAEVERLRHRDDRR